jgi:hypothetical protein
VRNTNGENVPIVENTVEAPVIENNQENTSNEIEHNTEVKSLFKLILDALMKLINILFK